MGALPFGFGPVLGGYTLALRAPPSTGATQVRGTVFSLHCPVQCVRALLLSLSVGIGIGIWHWLALQLLLCFLHLGTTTPYPDNCVAPRALSLSFSVLLHHPSSPPFWPLSQISISLFWRGHAKSGAKIQWRVPTATLAWSTGAVPVPTHWGISLGAADPGAVSHGRSTEYPNKKPPWSESEHWRATLRLSLITLGVTKGRPPHHFGLWFPSTRESNRTHRMYLTCTDLPEDTRE